MFRRSHPTPVPAGPGQESVWDYPRPPRVEPSGRRVRVVLGGEVIVDTMRALRVLETSHPPGFYLPFDEFRCAVVGTGQRSFCEFKGSAAYFTLRTAGAEAPGAAWSYPDPSPGYETLRDHLSLYPGRVDACYVARRDGADDEQVQAQAGGFYGGWITSDIVGPFKGEPGTLGW